MAIDWEKISTMQEKAVQTLDEGQQLVETLTSATENEARAIQMRLNLALNVLQLAPPMRSPFEGILAAPDEPEFDKEPDKDQPAH